MSSETLILLMSDDWSRFPDLGSGFREVHRRGSFGSERDLHGQNSRRARYPTHEPLQAQVHDKSGSVDLCLANCYFAHNSLRFPARLPFFNASSLRPFHPPNRRPDPVAPTWRRPFPRCRVLSAPPPVVRNNSVDFKVNRYERQTPLILYIYIVV